MNQVKKTIFFSVFISYLGLSVILPILAPIVRELGLSESQAGWMVSIGSISMAIMGPLWGRWSDQIGRKPIMMMGMIGISISYLLYTLVVYVGFQRWLEVTTIFILLVLARTLVGAFIPAVPSTAQAYMADITSSGERTSGMAMIGAANGLGLVFGPAIGGALAVLGLLFPLYLSILLPFIAFFIIAFIVPPQKSVSRETVPRLHLWHKRARPYLLIGFITVSSIITLQVNAGFYLQDTLKLTVEGTARILSVALTLSGLALVGTQVLQMKVLNWQPNKLILLGIPISILSLLLLLVTSSLSIYYVAFFIFGIGVGLIMPGFMSGASLAVSAEQQGAVAGLIAAVQGIAAIISPIVSTMLYEVNHSSPFWFLMSLFLFIFILWVPLTRTKKPVLQKEIS